MLRQTDFHHSHCIGDSPFHITGETIRPTVHVEGQWLILSWSRLQRNQRSWIPTMGIKNSKLWCKISIPFNHQIKWRSLSKKNGQSASRHVTALPLCLSPQTNESFLFLQTRERTYIFYFFNSKFFFINYNFLILGIFSP